MPDCLIGQFEGSFDGRRDAFASWAGAVISPVEARPRSLVARADIVQIAGLGQCVRFGQSQTAPACSRSTRRPRRPERVVGSGENLFMLSKVILGQQGQFAVAQHIEIGSGGFQRGRL